ncbi:diguanylate cyclase, partial [Kineococcus sp. T13]|uniref:diguanylate cyclase domain-containing protein n=1 Tax=Kineococcus vitellinus TaxID=2696565 RepID=UPI00141365FB|nr:diguanylate cyclase [Kineococcus vitellinus]
MVLLDVLRLGGFALALAVLVRRARRADGEQPVWRCHAAAVGVLLAAAAALAVLGAAGVPARTAALVVSPSTLPACLLVYRGLSQYNRVHSATHRPADWIVGTSCAFAVAAAGNALLQGGWFPTAASGLELQLRLVVAGFVAVVLATTLQVARSSGALRAPTTWALAGSLAVLLLLQLHAALLPYGSLVRVGAAAAWVALALSLAWASRRGGVLQRAITTSRLTTTTTAFGALLAAVAVLVATTLTPGSGQLRWSVVWAVAAVAGLGLRLHRLVRDLVDHERVRREATTDELTGLANRRAFTAGLEAATAAGGPLAVLLVDLDRFKEVNDRHGHATGDRLLQHVGRGFTSVLPGGSLLARLGGDEFAVLLRGASAAGAADAAARLVAVAVEHPLDGVH